MAPIRYLEIAEDLRARVLSGEFAAGHLLPSESELSRAYAVSRVTIRRALDVLRDERAIDAKQGLGWFVPAAPLRQSLGRLGTIEAQLEASGVGSQRRILDFGFVEAPERVASVLGVERVLAVRRLTLAADQAFAHVMVWCPERLGRSLSFDEVEQTTFYELLPVELGGATQTIAAAGASERDADVLGVPVGAPVLVCRRTTRDVAGTPVLYSEHTFPGHRTEFSVDLPHAELSMAPTGVRLVDGDGGTPA